MLLLNRKMTATQASENGLVMEVFKPDNFMEQVDSRVKIMTAMSNKVNLVIKFIWCGLNVVIRE